MLSFDSDMADILANTSLELLKEKSFYKLICTNFLTQTEVLKPCVKTCLLMIGIAYI